MSDQMRKHYDFSEAVRGPVLKSKPGKERITIRLDKDILEWFKNIVDEKGRGNYQTLINDVLSNYVKSQRVSDLSADSDAYRDVVDHIARSFYQTVRRKGESETMGGITTLESALHEMTEGTSCVLFQVISEPVSAQSRSHVFFIQKDSVEKLESSEYFKASTKE